MNAPKSCEALTSGISALADMIMLKQETSRVKFPNKSSKERAMVVLGLANHSFRLDRDGSIGLTSPDQLKLLRSRKLKFEIVTRDRTTQNTMPLGRFRLGRLVISEKAQSAIRSEDILIGLIRHWHGDWGDINEDAKAINAERSQSIGRLVSRYKSIEGIQFLITTDETCLTTTIHLSSES